MQWRKVAARIVFGVVGLPVTANVFLSLSMALERTRNFLDAIVALQSSLLLSSIHVLASRFRWIALPLPVCLLPFMWPNSLALPPVAVAFLIPRRWHVLLSCWLLYRSLLTLMSMVGP